MEEVLRGKRALVTGGSRGIGRGIALALGEAGADVAIGYRRQAEAARSVVSELEAIGRRALACAADVRDAAAVEAMVRRVHDELGGLDVVVANAGVASRFEPVHEVDPGFWERVVAIDLGGVFHTVRAVLPLLRAQRSGVILTVSSVGADACAPGGAPYVAAKAGVNALTRVVARENAAFNVRCNAIAPGLIETELADGLLRAQGRQVLASIPLGRIGTPREVGRLAVYLASDDASWITGKIFRIDGGLV